MSMSLHAAFVPVCRQMIGAQIGLIDKAEAFCAERGAEPEALIGMRFIANMLPLGYQWKSVATHSAGTIKGIRKGVLVTDRVLPEPSFDAYRAYLGEADAVLADVTPEEMDGWFGRDMVLSVRELRIDFDAEHYLLSFSLPNFFFHATTAYDILRAQGVAIDKRDFLGATRKRV